MVHLDHWHNGKKLVSVTELQRLIAKPFLDKWKQGLCVPGQVCGFERAKQIADEAADVGNKTHEYIEHWLKGLPLVSDDLWGKKIADKITELGLIRAVVAPEEIIIDNESGLAGSPDFVCRDRERVYIGDLKIKNSLDNLTGLQGAGYRYLIRRKHNVDIDKMLILWAQKRTKGLTVKPVLIDLNLWVEPFKALVTLWNVVNPSREVALLG